MQTIGEILNPQSNTNTSNNGNSFWIRDISQSENNDSIVRFYNDSSISDDKKHMLSDAIDWGMPKIDADKYISETFYKKEAPWLIEDAKSVLGWIAKKTSEAFGEWISWIKEAWEKWASWEINAPEALVRWVSSTFNAATSPIQWLVWQGVENLITEPLKAITPEPIKEAIKQTVEPKAKAVLEWYDSLPDDAKRYAEDAWAGVNVLLNILGAAPAVKALKTWEEAVAGWLESVEQLWKRAIQRAKTAIPKIESAAQWAIAKWAEEKFAKSIWQATAEWVIDWEKVLIPKPEKTFIETVTWPIRPSDTKKLAWRALTPSYWWTQSPKQVLETATNAEKNLRTLHKLVRTWKLEWNISTLEDAAKTVVDWLDSVWDRIWKAIEPLSGQTSISMWTRSDMTRALTSRIERRSGAYWALKNFFEDTRWGLSFKDAFKTKKIYWAEIRKLIKAWDAWTDSFSSLVKWVNELSENLDNEVAKKLTNPKFKEDKDIYSTLKKLAWDITKSAAVEWRRSPQTLVEQLWMLDTIFEGIKNPLSTAKNVFAKEIWEINTRWGSFKELVKLLDEEAIKRASKTKPTIGEFIWKSVKK